jgi:hypothetical protein
VDVHLLSFVALFSPAGASNKISTKNVIQINIYIMVLLCFLYSYDEGADIVAGGCIVLHMTCVAKWKCTAQPASAVNLLSLFNLVHSGNFGTVKVDFEIYEMSSKIVVRSVE